MLFSNVSSVSQLFSALRIPRTDASEMGRCYSGDVTGNVPHCRRWIDSIRSEIDSGEALQEIRRTALGYARITVNHDVFAQSVCVYLIAKHGQRDSRIVLNVFDFLMCRHVADYKLFVFYSDPHHGDLWAAV